MNTTDKNMALADKYADATFTQGLERRTEDPAPEQRRKALHAQIEALARDAEELAFLKNDLLSWVDRAVEKGNANSDIQEASERYDQWLKTRHAAMQEKQS